MNSEEHVMLMQQGGKKPGYAKARKWHTGEKNLPSSEPGLLSNTLWYKKSTDNGTSY